MASAALPFWLNRAQAASVAGVVTAAGTVRPAQVGQTPGIFANHASLSAAIACRPQWEALLASALQTNVFLEPAFALSAALHFAVSQRPAFLMVWRTETDMDRPELIGVCPYLTPGFSEFGVARVWNSNQSVLGMPLLHRDYAMQALAAIAVCLASGRTASPALLFTGVPQCGPTDRLIRAFAATSGRSLGTSGETTRACLSGGQAGLAALTGGLSAKQHKELRRQRRRLADQGSVTFHSARSPADVREGIEAFLTLEARGWKGRSGTAFLASPGQTAFLRSFTRDMAAQGKCRVDMLLRAGVPVAIGIVLTTLGEAAFWKITYDETCAALSPGVQLTQEISARQISDPTVMSTDSCAIANHPMIDRIWPERQVVADMLLGTQPHASTAFVVARARLGATQSLRSLAKHLYLRLRSGRTA